MTTQYPVSTTGPQWPANPATTAPQALVYPMPTLQQLQQIAAHIEWFERNATALDKAAQAAETTAAFAQSNSESMAKHAAAVEALQQNLAELGNKLDQPVKSAPASDQQVVLQLMLYLASVMPAASPLSIVQRARDLLKVYRIFYPA